MKNPGAARSRCGTLHASEREELVNQAAIKGTPHSVRGPGQLDY